MDQLGLGAERKELNPHLVGDGESRVIQGGDTRLRTPDHRPGEEDGHLADHMADMACLKYMHMKYE